MSQPIAVKTAPNSPDATPEKTFTQVEVLAKCLEYFNGDELAATTWMNKYAMKNKDGAYVEDNPDAMHLRMASQFARIERSTALPQKWVIRQLFFPTMDNRDIHLPKMRFTTSSGILNM